MSDNIKKSEKNTLTNEELIIRCEAELDKLIETGGKSFTMRVPAEPNNDTDLLLYELLTRFKKIIEIQESNKEKRQAFLNEYFPKHPEEVEIVQRPLEIKDLTDEQIEEFKKDWEKKAKGVVSIIKRVGLTKSDLFTDEEWLEIEQIVKDAESDL